MPGAELIEGTHLSLEVEPVNHSALTRLTLAFAVALITAGCPASTPPAGPETSTTNGGTSTAAPPPPAVAAPTIAAAPDVGFDKAKALPGYADVLKMKTSPKIGDLAATAKGKELFATNCASCHGPEGKGDGPAGLSLNPPPRNQTDTKQYKYGYGELGIFRTVKHGIPGTGMAAFPQLSDDDIWCVANFVRTLQKS